MAESNGKKTSWLWYSLLSIPCVGMLWVPFYNDVEPKLAGVPYFYWYQFAWIPVTAALTALVHVCTDQSRSDGDGAGKERV